MLDHLLGNLGTGDLTRMGTGTCETALDQARFKANHLELSGPDNITQRRDAHASHDFAQAALNDVQVALCRLLWRQVFQVSLTGQSTHAGQCERWHDRLSAITEE